MILTEECSELPAGVWMSGVSAGGQNAKPEIRNQRLALYFLVLNIRY